MRILHLSPHCDEVGNGVVNVAVDLAIKQRESGHVVGLASSGGSLEPLLDGRGVRCFPVELRLTPPLRVVERLRRLSAILAAFRPDIVHAHMVPGTLFARALHRANGFRLVSTVHNAPKPQAVLMGLADRVIVVSAANRDSMARRGIPRAKMRVIRNGPLGSPRRPSSGEQGPGASLDRPAVVTVARMFSQKGIGDLIEAFALVANAFPRWSLYLIGAGPEQDKFERQAAGTSCPTRIRFLGFRREIARLLSQADIFVLASRADPFPLVIPEARDAGCAIIGTDVDGIREGLEHGRAGLLIPPARPRALADALALLMGDAAALATWRERARSNLDWLTIDRVVRETHLVYEDALRCTPKLGRTA